MKYEDMSQRESSRRKYTDKVTNSVRIYANTVE